MQVNAELLQAVPVESCNSKSRPYPNSDKGIVSGLMTNASAIGKSSLTNTDGGTGELPKPTARSSITMAKVSVRIGYPSKWSGSKTSPCSGTAKIMEAGSPSCTSDHGPKGTPAAATKPFTWT